MSYISTVLEIFLAKSFRGYFLARPLYVRYELSSKCAYKNSKLFNWEKFPMQGSDISEPYNFSNL